MPGPDNRRKRVPDESPGPWVKWRNRTRAARAIRFIELYCRPPKGYGSGRPIRLAPFQKEWLRRVLGPGVTAAVMSLPRGNGKSSFLAAFAVWAVFDPDPESGAPQVPIVATAVHQAIRTTYGVAVAMIAAEPELANRSLPYTAIGATKIVVPSTGGELFPIANSVDGLQGLDPSVAICDEVGFMPLDSWNSLLLAGIKRPRSLTVGIGTPGIDEDNTLWHLRQKVSEGVAPAGFDFTEYAADEGCAVDDEDQWRKANPAIHAGYLNIDAMRTNLDLTPEGRFRVFHLGQWVDGVDGWLEPGGRKLWDSLTDPYEPVCGAPTWIGVDVAQKHDSTAVVAVQRRPDNRLHAWARFWIPTATKPVDVMEVMRYLRELDGLYNLVAVAYDPRLFDVPAQMLLDEGIPMERCDQTPERMVPAVGATYEAIRRGELSHDGDKTLAHQVLAAVTRDYERGFMLSKAKSRGRIDGADALCMAVHAALRSGTPAATFVL